MHIEVVSDTVCPWCFVGKRRLARALEAAGETGATIGWQPFLLNPEMPPEGVDRRAYLIGKFGSDERVREIYRQVEQAGEEEGIAFAFERIARMPSSLASLDLIRWAAPSGCQAALVETLFEFFFERGRDIGDPEILVDAARGAGLDDQAARDHLADGAGCAEIREQDRAIKRRGVHSVPCFVVDGRYVVTGAQPPEAFLPIFELARAGTG